MTNISLNLHGVWRRTPGIPFILDDNVSIDTFIGMKFSLIQSHVHCMLIQRPPLSVNAFILHLACDPILWTKIHFPFWSSTKWNVQSCPHSTAMLNFLSGSSFSLTCFIFLNWIALCTMIFVYKFKIPFCWYFSECPWKINISSNEICSMSMNTCLLKWCSAKIVSTATHCRCSSLQLALHA